MHDYYLSMAKIGTNNLTRLTAYVPATLMMAVKTAAANRGTTVSKLVAEALLKDRYLWQMAGPRIVLNKNKNGRKASEGRRASGNL